MPRILWWKLQTHYHTLQGCQMIFSKSITLVMKPAITLLPTKSSVLTSGKAVRPGVMAGYVYRYSWSYQRYSVTGWREPVQITSHAPLPRCLCRETDHKVCGCRHEIVVREFTVEFMKRCQEIGITRYEILLLERGAWPVSTQIGPRNQMRHSDRKILGPMKQASRLCALKLAIRNLKSTAQWCFFFFFFWLAHTDRQVRVVILIHIQADNKMLHAEHWEIINRDLFRTAEGAFPTKFQEFNLCLLADSTISAGPSSTSLDIPSNCSLT